MNELIRSLQEAMGRLELGKLDLEELERCTENAQAVYERFVVLRHKARETAVTAGIAAPAPEPAAPPAASVPPMAAIRLDTRPPEVHPQQTSLIDAIAETEHAAPPDVAGPLPEAPVAAERAGKQPAAKPESGKAAPLSPVDRPVTVADKLEQAPVADLRKAIALSQKFWFVAELFGGDRKRYEDALDALNAMNTADAAHHYFNNEVIAKLPKAPAEEVTTTFTDLLQRRFH